MNNCSYVLLFILYSLCIKSQPFLQNNRSLLRLVYLAICAQFLHKLPSKARFSFAFSGILSSEASRRPVHLFVSAQKWANKKERKGFFASGVFSYLRSFLFMAVFSAALLLCYLVVLPKPPSLWAKAASSSVMPKGRKIPCIMPCPAAICSVLPSRESFVSLH